MLSLVAQTWGQGSTGCMPVNLPLLYYDVHHTGHVGNAYALLLQSDGVRMDTPMSLVYTES